MHDSDKQEFMKVMKATADSYGRQPYMTETLRLWWGMLAEYDIVQVRQALQSHLLADPKFPPTIGGIVQILRGPEKSKGPGAEEAWGIAVKACDETETVIMTDQIAEAWGACKPIMDLGDEVGARMCFREVYERLMKSVTQEPKWWPSIGSDPHKRDSALSEAKKLGKLPSPKVASVLLPQHDLTRSWGINDRVEPGGKKSEPEGLRKLKEEMKKLNMKHLSKFDSQEQAAKEQKERDQNLKEASLRKLEQYTGTRQ